jgi:CrcB protein
VAIQLFVIGIAGAAGALSRYGINVAVRHWSGQAVMWPTFVANMLGCFLFGALVSLIEHRLPVSDVVKAGIFVGFLGSLTTFSTFAFDSTLYIREGHWGLLAANLILQNVFGVALLLLGLAVFRPH